MLALLKRGLLTLLMIRPGVHKCLDLTKMYAYKVQRCKGAKARRAEVQSITTAPAATAEPAASTHMRGQRHFDEASPVF